MHLRLTTIVRLISTVHGWNGSVQKLAITVTRVSILGINYTGWSRKKKLLETVEFLLLPIVI